ncbi:MAG: tetratricopeptide repeat protein, partial [Cyanophyceae cyanobacterium]
MGPYGECLMGLRDWDGLSELISSALIRHRQARRGLEIARDYRLLGEIALGRGRWEEAEESFKRALGSLAQTLFGESANFALWPDRSPSKIQFGNWAVPSDIAVRRGIYLWRLAVAQLPQPQKTLGHRHTPQINTPETRNNRRPRPIAKLKFAGRSVRPQG